MEISHPLSKRTDSERLSHGISVRNLANNLISINFSVRMESAAADSKMQAVMKAYQEDDDPRDFSMKGKDNKVRKCSTLHYR